MARSKNSTYLIGVETKALVTEPLVCVEMPPVEMFGVFSLFADGVFVLGETLKEESKSLIFSYRVLLKTTYYYSPLNFLVCVYKVLLAKLITCW